MPPPNSPQHHTHPFFSGVLNNPGSPASPRARIPSSTRQQQQPFTAAQRSAQARGKDYNALPVPQVRSGRSKPEPESFEQRSARLEAAQILDSTEMLMWHAARRNESLTQTRRHYTDIVLGLAEREIVWQEEWEAEKDVVTSSPARSNKGKERERDRERDKGKKRVSSGHAVA